MAEVVMAAVLPCNEIRENVPAESYKENSASNHSDAFWWPYRMKTNLFYAVLLFSSTPHLLFIKSLVRNCILNTAEQIKYSAV